jgi:hypothetical protein
VRRDRGDGTANDWKRRPDLILRLRGGRVLLRDERPDQVALDAGVGGRQLERLLKHRGGLVVRAAPEQHRAEQNVLHERPVDLVARAVEVGEADLNPQVVRVDGGHLLVGGDRLVVLPGLEVMVREHLILASRVLGQSLLVVQVGEAVVDLEPGRVDLVDLLVDRDRLQKKAVSRVEVGDPGEEGNGIGRPVHPDVEVADPVQGRDVLGIVVQNAQIVLQRLVELSLPDVLLRRLEKLVPACGHCLKFSPDCAAAGPARGASERRTGLPRRIQSWNSSPG